MTKEEGDRPDTWPGVFTTLISAAAFLALVALCLGWRPWQ